MEVKTAGDLLTTSVIGWRREQEKIDGRFFLFFFFHARSLRLRAVEFPNKKQIFADRLALYCRATEGF